ncbi:MAG: plasmid mobilization relaxosome protein MobC [Caulobacterales bacterium]|nr:plasmid mobilization relaxosome protein MobC [Caulobacterales bacterium]
MTSACGPGAGVAEPLAVRPAKLTERLAALVRSRLRGRPTLAKPDTAAVTAIQGELRRIGVNINQIARALNVAVLEGRVLEVELTYLDELRREMRAHLRSLRDALLGVISYWQVEG